MIIPLKLRIILMVFLFTDSNDSQSKLDLHSPYNLHEELKKILFVHKKEKVHACANRTEFQFLVSCFHNYEVNYAVIIMICLSVCVCVFI